MRISCQARTFNNLNHLSVSKPISISRIWESRVIARQFSTALSLYIYIYIYRFKTIWKSTKPLPPSPQGVSAASETRLTYHSFTFHERQCKPSQNEPNLFYLCQVIPSQPQIKSSGFFLRSRNLSLATTPWSQIIYPHIYYIVETASSLVAGHKDASLV